MKSPKSGCTGIIAENPKQFHQCAPNQQILMAVSEMAMLRQQPSTHSRQSGRRLTVFRECV